MSMFYSSKTGGFYSRDIHGDQMPHDAAEVSEHDYQALLSGQCAGDKIVANAAGYPVIERREPDSLETLIKAARTRIDLFYRDLYNAEVANDAIAAEYNAAYVVAKDWLQNPAATPPERVKALAETYGISNQIAAALVVQKWTEAQSVAFDRRGAARLRAKLAIGQARTAEEVATAEAAGRASMEAVVYAV